MFDLTLTFDNGPEPSVTPMVLDVLARRSVRTTFFVIGNKLMNPDARACAERAHVEGHWIGNHTWTHSRPLGEQPGADAAELEIARTQVEIGALSHPDRLFRPTGGGGHLDRRLLSPEAAGLLQDGGYTCVLWNAIPRDWADPDGWVETALAQLARQSWTLMVLHDLPSGAMRHLDRFLAEVRERGGHLRQDFPPSCLPITCGRITGPLTDFVSAGAEGSLGGIVPPGSHVRRK
jgi:peptidoglycan/xylan/chitin deacetylase (PgdA/CDA1 family)